MAVWVSLLIVTEVTKFRHSEKSPFWGLISMKKQVVGSQQSAVSLPNLSAAKSRESCLTASRRQGRDSGTPFHPKIHTNNLLVSFVG